MKKTITLITLFIFSMTVFAQEKNGKINGTVTDAGQKPIEAATVQLLKADTKALVKAVLTNKEGVFEIEKVAAGKYILSVSAVAFTLETSAVIELTTDKMNFQSPAIQLGAASKELSGLQLLRASL